MKLFTAGVLLASLSSVAFSAPVVSQPLPAAIDGPIASQPSRNHVWVPGYWYPTSEGYAWVSSHWEMPPRMNSTWVAPRWEAAAGGFILVSGAWMDTQSSEPESYVSVIEIDRAPPAPLVEVIRERPSSRHVWIGGFWNWNAGRHIWVAGRWDLPPHDHYVWDAPRWDHRNGRYSFVQGRWRDSSSTRVSVGIPIGGHGSLVISSGGNDRPNRGDIIREAPPPPRHEQMRERDRPSRSHVWISGYYVRRNGHYDWVPGHWAQPPRERAAWVAPRWEARSGGFIFIEGTWR